jgi:hypothetical protein
MVFSRVREESKDSKANLSKETSTLQSSSSGMVIFNSLWAMLFNK